MRRRPLFTALGALLVVMCGLGGAALFTNLSDATPVVAMQVSVVRGQAITRDDLTTANISTDPVLQTVPAAQLGSLIGQTATTDLPAGSLVGPDSVTSDPIPAPGESVVGLLLNPGQLPGTALAPGDKIRIILTQREQDEPSRTPPQQISGRVVSLSTVESTGQTTLSVAIPTDNSALVAMVGASGRAAVIRDGA